MFVRFLAPLLLLVLVLPVQAQEVPRYPDCTPLGAEYYESAQADLDAARDQWERHRTPDYVVTYSGLGGNGLLDLVQPITVHVRADSFHALYFGRSGASDQGRLVARTISFLADSSDVDWYTTYAKPTVSLVDGLFDRIETLIQSGARGDGAPALSVRYHAEAGYPERVELDPRCGSIDDEFYVSVSVGFLWWEREDEAPRQPR